jgi:hypothetical protein
MDSTEMENLSMQVQQLRAIHILQSQINELRLNMVSLERKFEVLRQIKWPESEDSSTTTTPDTDARLSLLEVQMSDFLCCVCLDKKRCIVFNPCHHHVTCGSCCTELMEQEENPKCPICRTIIDSFILVHES